MALEPMEVESMACYASSASCEDGENSHAVLV